MIDAKLVNIHAVHERTLKTALHCAAEGGHVACLKVLLDGRGADVMLMAVDNVCVSGNIL